MLKILAYAWLYLLITLLIISVCVLLALGSDMVEKDRAERAKEQAKREKELTFNDGPSRWETQRTVNRLLKADKKRPRRVW